MKQVVDIYQYTDYRAYLKDWYELSKKRESYVSYRYISRRTGVDAGYLARVLQGNKHLAERSLEAFSKMLQLDEQESRYLLTMVRFSKARRDDEIRDLFQKLMVLRESNARILDQSQYRYWMHWYIPAIRLTLLTYEFRGDFKELAQRITPAITPAQAEEAVDVLLSLGLVQRNQAGIYEVQDSHLSTGDTWTSMAIREFQGKTLDLARQSLRDFPPELREIATLSLAIPMDEIVSLQEMMRTFRKQVAQWALGLERSDCVVQFNLSCFPLALPPEKNPLRSKASAKSLNAKRKSL